MTAAVSSSRAPSILHRLGGFFDLLRGRGVAVGIGAELDLGHAIQAMGLLNRMVFHDACRATLAKSPGDLAILDDAFALYWKGGVSPTRSDDEFDIPASPPGDHGSGRLGEPPQPRADLGSEVTVQIGTYSPDAPPSGHPFSSVDPGQLAGFRAGARRFRRFAAAIPGRRRTPSRHGRVDFLATARRGMRHGGEWLELRRRSRRPLRAELFVLWDVSGSMREHDDELLALVYALHRAARHCRVFAFSTHLQELTRRFAARPYPRLTAELSRFMEPAAGGTRIGRCLSDFRTRYGAQIQPWTTIVILSDGWDMGETGRLSEELARLRARARRLVWVNPYAGDPDFRPETAGMKAAVSRVDVLVSPRDFGSRRTFWLAGGRPNFRRAEILS